MALMLKPGVVLTGLRPEMVIAAMVVADAYRELGVDAVITSAVDGTHSETSLHYAGAALDFRTRDFGMVGLNTFVAVVRERLGHDFDVILEKDHCHVEYQPRRPGGEVAVAQA